jgi:hypothetical protein
MSFLNLFRRKQEDEASRVARLSRTGRIADGVVLDATSDSNGLILQVCYSYTIAGVQYESSQDLNREQQKRYVDYSPGTSVTVRYDPRQPANSLVI